MSNRKKWIRRSIKLILFLIAFNTLEHFCHVQTRGFSLRRIHFDPKEPLSLSSDASLPAINQPFHYYSQGNQCFVFLSEDGQYVLKFFKYANQTLPAWTAKIPLLNRFKPFRPTRVQKTTWKRTRDFHGYQIAFDHLKEETGLLALHLHPTQNVYPTIKIRDKLNIAHQVNLNQTPFVLQKRATPTYQQFSLWIQNHEIDKVEKGITSLMNLYVKRAAQNIHDDDAIFYSNTGFIGETPILIDPGHFILDSSSPTAEMQKLTKELKKWFSKKYPPMVSYVETASPH